MKLESLKKRGSQLAKAAAQVELLEKPVEGIPSFADKLETFGFLPLRPKQLEILQVNLGYMCNQTCAHCHVDAGPDRKEIMDRTTMKACLRAVDLSGATTVDLTGGAPEMNPDFLWFCEQLLQRNCEIIVRSNLTILVSNQRFREYVNFFAENGIRVIASMPCYTAENVDKQRGNGVFRKSIEALQLLNSVGYGKPGSGLKLDLVYNPGGPSIAPSQDALKSDYDKRLGEDFGIVFNELFTITNLPISRFLDDLLRQGRYEEYMDKLVNAFNPATVENVMCRNTLSVRWDGQLYDCDFNQMLEIPVNGNIGSITDFDETQLAAREIALNNHCYGCTAGAGSSCQGSLV